MAEQTEKPSREGNLPIDTLEDLLDHYYEIRRTGWHNNPPRKEILERFAALEANQITPEMWALLDEAKAAGKEGDGGREFFALRKFLNRLETLRGANEDDA